MKRALASLLFCVMPSIAWAAGGFDDAPLYFLVLMYAAVSVVVFLPTAGFGYLLQGFVRLRYAVAILLTLWLALFGSCAIVWGIDKAIQNLSLFTALFFLLNVVFALGWYLGTSDIKRHTASKNLT